MKKALLILTALFFATAQAQDVKPTTPQIAISGEGKVKATPDQAFISVTVESKGNIAAEVKKDNNIAVDKVVQFIKKMKLAKEDVQTQQVALNADYNYPPKKKQSFTAVQTIDILLKDLAQYDLLMEGLIDAGVNRINSVEFKSSKLAQYQSEARKLAMKDAKMKAEDFVSVLGQKVGKAILISDNSQAYYPQPVYAMAAEKLSMNEDASAPKETLIIGEINITANVSVSFILE
jgi:uncharacterized protein YggE